MMFRGLGANPNPGTYSDINCPTKCWLVGNGLDTMLFGNDCWPCHNICQSGQKWDTANKSCSATPEGQNPEDTAPPDSTDKGCPGYCDWVPFATSLFKQCVPCAANTSSSSSGLTGMGTATLIGVGLAAVVGVVLIGKLMR